MRKGFASMSGRLFSGARARRAAWLTLVAAAGAAVACSSNNTPPPDSFASITMGPGAGDACPFASNVSGYLEVGTATADKPTTVADGAQSGDNGVASVTCTVHPQGNGFDIQLSVQVNGTYGGSLVITSPQGMGAVTASSSSGITAAVSSVKEADSFSATNCTITYEYMGAAVPVSPPIAAGRIWGHLSCPQAVVQGGQMTTGPDGGPTTASCAAEGDFLFENCSQ
jgi:hypothetical protein